MGSIFTLLLLVPYVIVFNVASGNINHFLFEPVLQSKCRLHPDVLSPTEFLGYPTNVNFSFKPLRFRSLNSVKERFSVNGILLIDYPIPCAEEVNAAYPGQVVPKSVELPADKIWRPPVEFNKCYGNCQIDGPHYTRHAKYSTKLGAIRYSYVGLFQTQCDQHLWAFPYDL